MRSFLLCLIATLAGFLLYAYIDLTQKLSKTETELRSIQNALKAEKEWSEIAYDSGFDGGVEYQKDICHAEKRDLKKEFYELGYEDGSRDTREECDQIRKVDIHSRDSIIEERDREIELLNNRIRTLVAELAIQTEWSQQLADKLLDEQSVSDDHVHDESKEQKGASSDSTEMAVPIKVKYGITVGLFSIFVAFTLVWGRTRGVF